MKRKTRILSLLLGLTLCLSLLPIGASAAELTQHDWVKNFKDPTQTTIPAVTGRILEHVLLYPGDTVTFVSNGPYVAGEGGRTNSYDVGAHINDKAEGVEGHLTVETTALGTPNEGCDGSYITKITCIGTQPVFLWYSGGGACSTDPGIAYYAYSYSYRLVDEYVPIEYKYKCSGADITAEVQYYDETPVTKAYAADGQASAACPGNSVSVTLGHPYIEGYQFYKWERTAYTNKSGEYGYNLTLTNESDGSQSITWSVNEATDGSAATYGLGTTFVLTATFFKNPTVTLNAAGGTIEGYDSKIYECVDLYHFNLELSEKIPVRDGYTFAGWYTDESCTTAITDITELKLTNDKYPDKTTLYAKWTASQGSDPDPDPDPVPDPDPTSFTDVASDAWYADSVAWAVENNVTKGTSSTTFSPSDDCTRAQMLTFLWRFAGAPVVNYALPFTDLDGCCDDYMNAIRWAVSQGITKGTSSTTFSPDDPVTREQVATMLYRYIQSQGGGYTGDWSFPLNFVDAGDIHSWADEAMHWCVQGSVIQGVGHNKLAPTDTATRAEIVTILYRYSSK